VSSLGVYNQVHWPGVGDVDDCWVISTFWVLVAAGILTRDQLPSVHAFRDAAGVPDKPGPTGGSNAEIVRALNKLTPEAGARLFSGNLSGFVHTLKSGYIASLAVNSMYLPSYLRFGFKGRHQIAVVYQNGKLYVMNPLAKEGSSLLQISQVDLALAAITFSQDGRFHGVMVRIGGAVRKALDQAIKQLNLPPVIRPYTEMSDFIDGFAVGKFYRSKHKVH